MSGTGPGYSVVRCNARRSVTSNAYTPRFMPRPITVLASVYLALLAASHALRLVTSEVPVPSPGARVVEVAAVGGTAPRVAVSYLDLGSDRSTSDAAAPVVLIHGSPGSKQDLAPLGRALSTQFRVLVPDLPGFGDSTASIPDYSFDAHARYLAAVFNRLGIARVHLVGFSMGGGVVLRFAERFPDRVASLTLVSAIGVQEMELFGDYRINHLVHGAQVGLVWSLSEAVPQFGVLDRARVLSYARNFYDSDQRPLRGALSRLSMPVEIVHGSRDPLVPVQAAREHARLVPQSELTIADTDHFFAMRDSERLARIVDGFIGRVDRGQGKTRATADPSRIARAAEAFDPRTIPPLGPVAHLLVVVLLPLATLISEDLACIGAGMLVALGRLHFVTASIACFAGIVAGDVGLFVVGRLAGRPLVVRIPGVAACSGLALFRAREWVERRGATAILLSRFLPGARLPTYVAAGLLGMGPWVFVRAMLVAAALWTPLLVGVAALLTRWGLSQGHLAPATGAVAISTVMIAPLQLLRSASTYRGRRALVSVWRRITRWEFWPPWAFYLPVVCWIAMLMIRYRSATVFTATNPGIAGGGFVGESKTEILRALANGGARVAPFITIEIDLAPYQRRAAARAFIESHGLPVVVKPDQGQRGSGVQIVRDEQQLFARLVDARHRLIVQAFVPGVEFGVFYARRPEARGRIISLTEKRFPVVAGDGRRTLDELILDDPRAVAMVRAYRQSCGDDVNRIVPSGETVTLCELGSHCRGAIFLDGRQLLTPALETAIERASRAFPGFSFGRFDVRAPSIEAFTKGEFTILELNGVTSEPTHVYDPSYGLFDAIRIVAATWGLAFEIGHAHAKAGARVWTLGELFRMYTIHRRYRRTPSNVGGWEGCSLSRRT